MHHYDLHIHQHVNTVLPHWVFPHLAFQQGSFTQHSSNSTVVKGQRIIPVSPPFNKEGEMGLTEKQKRRESVWRRCVVKLKKVQKVLEKRNEVCVTARYRKRQKYFRQKMRPWQKSVEAHHRSPHYGKGHWVKCKSGANTVRLTSQKWIPNTSDLKLPLSFNKNNITSGDVVLSQIPDRPVYLQGTKVVSHRHVAISKKWNQWIMHKKTSATATSQESTVSSSTHSFIDCCQSAQHVAGQQVCLIKQGVRAKVCHDVAITRGNSPPLANKTKPR